MNKITHSSQFTVRKPVTRSNAPLICHRPSLRCKFRKRKIIGTSCGGVSSENPIMNGASWNSTLRICWFTKTPPVLGASATYPSSMPELFA